MESISIDQLAGLGDAATLIDVREPEEFEDGRVPWAVNIPLSELVERVDEVPLEGTIHLICKSGGRSARAAEYLERTGRDVANVEGGTDEWIAEGLDIESDEVPLPAGARPDDDGDGRDDDEDGADQR